jgi:hypothetical protein
METQSPVRQPSGLAGILVATGTSLLILSIGGLILVQVAAKPEAALAHPTKQFNWEEVETTSVDSQEDLRPTVTPLPPPTLIQPAGVESTSQTESQNTQVEVPVQPLPTFTPGPTPTPRPPSGPPSEWTEEEKNALSWMCYGEVGGMGEVKIDACLSVISTVHARYAQPNGFDELNLIDALLRPGQFHISIETGRPAPDSSLYDTVEQYQAGSRGSCDGYLYFDSVPGGPSLCVINASNGQFLDFHNG